MTRTRIATLVLAALATVTGWAAGPLGTTINYQGQLKLNGGPVTGNADMIFTLWTDASGGAQVGPTLTFDGLGGNPAPVSVAAGLFTVGLDFGATAFDGNGRWLNIQVRYPSGGGAYTALTPRQALSAAPYALYALKAPGSGLWTGVGSAIVNTNSGFVGVNRSSQVSGAEFFGIQAPVTGSSYGGMYIRTDGNDAKPFYGYSTNGQETAWTYLEGATNKWHVHHAGADQLTIDADGNVGINDTTPTACLDVSSTTGDAIDASTTAAFSVGVTGTGTTAGVKGVCGSSNGYGVFGQNNTNGGEGVRGSTSASGAAAVAGYGNFATGVYGQTSSGYAIYGSSSGSGYAGYFNGDAHVNGTLSKNGGAFKIDHPLDPANMYLAHSFVESPDMMNIYNGVVVTDENGHATVALPDWFEALNQEFRYQLTVIDSSDDFILAKVTREIEGNTFVLRTSLPLTKVSWQVTGVRHDAWAQAHRIKVEQVKPDAERGRYLNPELFGLPPEFGLSRHVDPTPAASE